MKIDEQQVRYVAGLANLRLTAEEISRMARELNDILAHIDQLREVDTSEVGPMAQVLYDAGDTDTLREDVEGETLLNETALENAHLKGSGCFKVPLVIER